MLTDRYDDAHHFAIRLHRSRSLTGPLKNLIFHLEMVSAMVIGQHGDEDQAIGALLHHAGEGPDRAATLADIRARFGEPVAQIICDCTDSWDEPPPDWRKRKAAYLERLVQIPKRSLIVSLADKTHNAETILSDYAAVGDRLWGRLNGGADGTRWYYGTLSEVFTQTMPGRLSERLAAAVVGFSR